MIKKTVVYEDFNGNVRTEELYFNLSKLELTEMQLSIKGGLAETVQAIIETEDKKELLSIFKQLILSAYGIKSEDGLRFVKTQELRDAFASSAAFPELYMEIATDADKASEFVRGIMPKNV